ncbi:MAG: carbohydrate ABC transporter permease [Armatimonadota bacterium]
MPHLAMVGRKSLKSRVIMALMYLLLGLGGITMIVPFLIWVSTSFKSDVDSLDFDLVPAYWVRNDMLLRKYIEQQTNYDLMFYERVSRDPAPKMAQMTLPQPANAAERQDYYQYLQALPDTYVMLGSAGYTHPTFRTKYGITPVIAKYRDFLTKRYGTAAEMNKAYHTTEKDFQRITPVVENWWSRLFQPMFDRHMDEFQEFKMQQPREYLMPVPGESVWYEYLRQRIDNDHTKVNEQLGTDYTSIDEATFPHRVPTGNPALAKAWEECVRQNLSLFYVRADAGARPAWIAFLRKRYQDNITLYQRAHKNSTADFTQIALPKECPRDTVTMGEWNDFITTTAPIASLTYDTPEERYRSFLREKYQTVAAVNNAYATTYADWDNVLPPNTRVWAANCNEHAGAIRWEFASRNYSTVFNYIVLHGRAFANTIVYIMLALLVTLTVNPIAAYALSRFKMPSANRILLFLLATMAFPAEISMIPNFLLLKQLSLLNTFWALVLPGMASGFSIFLLKGMFDALPQDLYEAAELDGAGEATIFYRITIPLVKPFLAYLALGTFTAAYGAFAFAFILCPDPKMWTLMVYLQQMEYWYSKPVQFAGFVLAAIPTLIVFIACQRVIMQGIVLPTEK